MCHRCVLPTVAVMQPERGAGILPCLLHLQSGFFRGGVGSGGKVNKRSLFKVRFTYGDTGRIIRIPCTQ